MATQQTSKPELSPFDRAAPHDVQQIAAALKREKLVGRAKAAELLRMKASNFKRDAAPHLTVVRVEGSADVYFRSEVRKLARERDHRRAARNGV